MSGQAANVSAVLSAVFIVEGSDACTREHEIIAVFSDEAEAHKYAERLNAADPAGYDHGVGMWPVLAVAPPA